MLDLNKLFSKLENKKYFITKIDVPYVPQDFPEKYAVGKDIDLIVSRSEYMTIKTIVKIFSKEYESEFEQQWINEDDGFRIRFETNGSLHFQIDVKYSIDDIEDDFLIESLNNRIKKNGYYITRPRFELKFRQNAFNKNKNKYWHLEWIRRNTIKENDVVNFILDDVKIKNIVEDNECYIKGECGDLRFKGIGTPSINDLSNNMIELNKISNENMTGISCAVIGNSPILLDKDYGKDIDSHDLIIRCNLGRVDGFEDKVGSQTDFRFVACKSFTREKLDTHKGYDFKFLPSLNNQHFFIRYDKPNPRGLIGGMINNYKGNNKIHYVLPDFVKQCDILKNGYSSIGFIASIFASCFYDRVSLYGFNFFKEDIQDSHYFEKVKEGTSTGHDFKSEENVLRNIENIEVYA